MVIYHLSWARCYPTVIPTTQEAEVGGSQSARAEPQSEFKGSQVSSPRACFKLESFFFYFFFVFVFLFCCGCCCVVFKAEDIGRWQSACLGSLRYLRIHLMCMCVYVCVYVWGCVEIYSNICAHTHIWREILQYMCICMCVERGSPI